MKNLICKLIGHKWHNDYCANYEGRGAYVVRHCERCYKNECEGIPFEREYGACVL